MSIYANLFQYRPRENRNPREDFLSAALADVLNRLPPQKSIEFVSDVLLRDNSHRNNWLSFIDTLISTIIEPTLYWATQVRVTSIINNKFNRYGIIDMLLFVEGREAIIIENKIVASIGYTKDEDDNERLDGNESMSSSIVSVEESNQLQVYGHWLGRRCAESKWRGALVLLTHFTEPPVDFHGSNGKYGVPTLGVCRWGAVWRWMKGTGAQANPNTGIDMWLELCAEMAEFLEEQNMTSEYMTIHDVASAENFVSSAARFARTFEEAIKAIEPVRVALSKENLSPNTIDRNRPCYDARAGAVWTWFYVKRPLKKRTQRLVFRLGYTFSGRFRMVARR
jgi:hypothetical protein